MTRAVILSGFGGPDVLTVADVDPGQPGPRQIRVSVRYAGVGPTDLALRSGHLKAFGVAPGSVLGFEAAGVVDAVGAAVTDVAPGDEVAVYLPGLGGYAQSVIAGHWVPKPPSVSWADAAALPASGEAAVRVLRLLGVTAGETLLILGGAGAVGTIATQLATAAGVRVVAAVREDDADATARLGATPVDYAKPLREIVPSVDAVLDASGRSDLAAAVELAGGARRVITLSDPRGPQLGVTLSGPDLERATDAVATAMAALADGSLTLRPSTAMPLSEAAAAHAGLESGALRTKIVLTV
ncbi:NADP-dependent oxidoreductase [Actinoplanes sp. URMC 104]|uniref:NADP-dependent oxidoreductase n=1 Tax=Actinoplanes sp. URMC 104 TaxID=3423409 RepID=UPI003F1A8C76